MDGKRNGIFKLRDLFQRQKQESDSSGGCVDESSELEFTYKDTDTCSNEISELYSYTEVPEFKRNLAAYETLLTQWNIPLQWQKLDPEIRKTVVLCLVNHLEMSNKSARAEAARALLYISQGCWNEVQSDQEQHQWTRYNVFLLIKLGVFIAVVDILSLEIEFAPIQIAIRKPAISRLADSADLRVILNILYTIVETVRWKEEDDSEEFEELRRNFKVELGQPIREELLASKLFNMVIKFCGGSASHFPIKKVLLLLWKVILFSLGGTVELRELKGKYRELAALSPLKEDTIQDSKTMRAASPPASATDFFERKSRRPLRMSLMKQSSLDESAAMELEMNDQIEDEMKEIEQCRAMEEFGQSPLPRPTPMTRLLSKNKGLPWTPKVRQKDLDAFLDASRMKFVGFPIQGDRNTLAGLPAPIHEGVKVLKQHIYVSLSEWQISHEEELAKCPLSLADTDKDESPGSEVENLYAAIHPSLNQYVIALLKILLAAAPTSKIKSGSINIMADVLPEELPMTVVQSMKLGIDVARHKEIIVKAISSIIVLLLKHTKINHIYQFEFITQHLVFANCIPLILKFFNQNITAYISAKNAIALTDFPSCVLIGEPPELTPESLELGEPQPYCWRNLFACINLLRILNKLTKWEHSRIMMLVVFKSAPILKRSLRVKHPLLQLYILKLLKMQTKYLGRQWRNANMKTMSAIYQKVRHRLTDDWAYGNDLDARLWDFQLEGCALRAAVDRFNSRRYGDASKMLPDFEPIDKCVTSALGRPVQLTNTFKENYELWLEQEVFKNPVDWDEMLKCHGIM